MDGEVVFLRSSSGALRPHVGQEVTAEVRAEARREQARRRAEFEYRLAGALMRSNRLPKRITATLGHGAANLMLAMIVQGELVPASAKEAAEVAKAAYEIARAAEGRGVGDGPLSEQDRRALMEQAAVFERQLRERAARLSSGLLGGHGADVPDTEVLEMLDGLGGPDPVVDGTVDGSGPDGTVAAAAPSARAGGPAATLHVTGPQGG